MKPFEIKISYVHTMGNFVSELVVECFLIPVSLAHPQGEYLFVNTKSLRPAALNQPLLRLGLASYYLSPHHQLASGQIVVRRL